MKRNGKLLALVMAVAMVMTMVVIPVSAAVDNPEDSDYIAPTGVNLFDEWGYSWDYDKDATNAKTTLYGNAKPLSFTGRMPNANNATFTLSALNSGNGGRGRYTNGTISSTSYPCVQNVPVEADSVYKFTVDVKLVEDATDTMVFANNNNTSVTRPKDITTVSMQRTANNTTWTTIEYYFIGEKKTNYTETGAKTCHIGLYTTNGGNFCIDNWTLTKIGAPSVESAVGNIDSTVTFTFNKDVTLKANNFKVSPAGPTVQLSGSGSEYTVALSGYTAGTKYTITTQNIKDEFGQAMSENASAVIYAFDILDLSTTVYDFENEVPTGLTQTTAEGTVYDGDASITITADGVAGYDTRFIGFAGIQEGTYIVSFYAKAAEGKNAVKVGISDTMTTNANSNLVSTKNRKGDYIEINDSGWTKVTGYFQVVQYTYADATAYRSVGFYVAPDAENAGTYYIDNVQVTEVSNLDIENDIRAVKNVNKDGDLELSLYYGTEKTVYFAAAKYDGSGKLVDVKLDTVQLDVNGSQTATLKNVTGEYKVFVWDNNLAPLNNVLTLSDF